MRRTITRITPAITPVHELPGHGWRRLFIKDETQQISGAFKFRGVVNKLSTLPPGAPLATASTGNHAGGLSIAAEATGHELHVFVPQSTPKAKLRRIRDHGAQIFVVAGMYDDAEREARHHAARERMTYVHSFDDPDIIAGHTSLFVEAVQQGVGPEVVFVPVGGGGLVSAAIKAWGGGPQIVGVEHASAPAMRNSLRTGSRCLLPAAHGRAEGLMVRRVGKVPFEIAMGFGLRVAVVTDGEVERAVRILWNEAGVRAEYAGAAALAVAIREPRPGREAFCVVSGGNIDDTLWERSITGKRRHSR
jgi:threonine dehydratase